MLLRVRCAWLRYSSDDMMGFCVPPRPWLPWYRESTMPRPRVMSCCRPRGGAGMSVALCRGQNTGQTREAHVQTSASTKS